MTPDRWREVSRIYGAVLTKPESDRPTALDSLCANDAELRAEVESLLKSGADAALIDRAATERPSTLGLLDGRAIGTQIGVFRIDSLLGVGGMGEVYRARDTKLNRDVAIKILPPAFASDPERLARFKREAQVLASLNHPNIGAIHGFEDQGGVHALVLELVEGPTLADMLDGARASGSGLKAQGPSGARSEALAIAGQIANALEAAHELGIIHRDLKPANIKVRDDGTVKVLDFGLAKITEAGGEGRPGGGDLLTQSPTITTPAMTAAGIILGTAAYMSPEQAKGKPADKRSDIWAFGCVLYEMLTGTRPFQGEDIAETLAEVIKGAPDWKALPAETPAPVDRLLRGCLEKDRKRRVADASTIRFALDEPPAPVVTTAAAVSHRNRFGPAAVSVALAGLLVIAAVVWSRTTSEVQIAAPVARFVIEAPEGFRTGGGQIVAISPDGANIVFGSTQQFYLRNVADLQARPIPGTGGNADSPMFSPDGRWLAFYTAFDRKIKKVALSGGAVTTICDVPDLMFGGTWAPDGFIYFGQPSRAGIFRVPASGGMPTRVVEVKPGEYAYGPQLLPDGDGLMFTVAGGRAQNYYDSAQIVVQSLKSGNRTVVMTGGSDARWTQSGHLLYALGHNVLAVPFNPDTLRVGGSPVVAIEGVRRGYGLVPSATTQFSVSNTGALVYVSGNEQLDVRLVLVDRSGKQTPLNIPPGPYAHPRLSPDGSRLALYQADIKGQNIAIYDLDGKAPLRPLTFDGINTRAVWTLDGDRLIFTANRSGVNELYSLRADGTGEMTLLLKPEENAGLQAEALSRDGHVLVVSTSRGGQRLLMMFRPGVDTTLTPIAPVWSSNSVLSPDGKWIAYMAAELGAAQDVWVRPFPPAGETKFQVTSGGAADPVWSPDGKEIFYVTGRGTPDSRIVSMPVRLTPTFSVAGRPTPLPITGLLGSGARVYDISPDGLSFVVLMPNNSEVEKVGLLNVTLNWFEELKQRVPTP